MLLLMMLVVCLNGTILVEQPANSFLEWYPRFRDFIRMLQDSGGLGAVPCLEMGRYIEHRSIVCDIFGRALGCDAGPGIYTMRPV